MSTLPSVAQRLAVAVQWLVGTVFLLSLPPIPPTPTHLFRASPSDGSPNSDAIVMGGYRERRTPSHPGTHCVSSRSSPLLAIFTLRLLRACYGCQHRQWLNDTLAPICALTATAHAQQH